MDKKERVTDIICTIVALALFFIMGLAMYDVSKDYSKHMRLHNVKKTKDSTLVNVAK